MKQKTKILYQGAEAVITKKGNRVLKDRIKKSYRIPQIDNKLRKRRTKSESKLIEKTNKLISAPKVLAPDNKSPKETHHDNYQIIIEYISGKRLSDNLEKLNYQTICKQIGKNIAKLHDSGIIHGDLTTSNMILVERNLQYILIRMPLAKISIFSRSFLSFLKRMTSFGMSFSTAFLISFFFILEVFTYNVCNYI